MFSQTLLFDDEFDPNLELATLWDVPGTVATPDTNVDLDWNKIAGSADHIVAIKADGTMWSRGTNTDGELGVGDNIDKTSFTQIGSDTDWESVTCGVATTIAIKTDGTMWATGVNASNQLGIVSTASLNTMTQVGTDTDWSKVNTQYIHTLAIKDDGTLHGTGDNNYGQLGSGTSGGVQAGFIEVATELSGSSKTAVSCGEIHSGITYGGKCYTVGGNLNGQLGLGHNSAVSNFAKSKYEGTDIYGVPTCGKSHTMIDSNSGTYACGLNSSGQLGTGDTTTINYFSEVSSFVANRALKLFAYGTRTQMIDLSGFLKVTSSNVFQQVGASPNWLEVSAPQYALSSDLS